ncbi:MAG: LysE family transporter [Pseudomonadota bacterium]
MSATALSGTTADGALGIVALWPQMVTAWAVFAGNILSPGPNVFTTVAIAVGSGRAVALAVVPAIAIGVLGWALLAMTGARVVFQALPWAQPLLTALGGTLLIVFAWRYARAAWARRLGQAEGRQITARDAFLTSLAVLAANPKALTTWLVLVTIFPAATAAPEAVAAMIAGSVVVACAGHAGYAIAFSTPPAAAAFARAGPWVLAGVAAFFASLGATLIVEASAAL